MVTDSDEVDRDVDSTFKPSDPSSSGWISVFHLDNVSRYGHDMVMKVMISQLKAKLSAYLHRVRQGETLTILDRKTPVARIVPHVGESEDLRLTASTRPVRDIAKVRGVRTKRPVDVVGILAETRGDR